MASTIAPPPGLQHEATNACGMLMEANQTPSVSEGAETPCDYDWPADDRIGDRQVRATESDSDFELLQPDGNAP